MENNAQKLYWYCNQCGKRHEGSDGPLCALPREAKKSQADTRIIYLETYFEVAEFMTTYRKLGNRKRSPFVQSIFKLNRGEYLITLKPPKDVTAYLVRYSIKVHTEICLLIHARGKRIKRVTKVTRIK